MAKNIRQRKDELIAAIRTATQNEIDLSNVAPRVEVHDSGLYTEYKNTLYQNGIRNDGVIKAQLDRFMQAGLSKAAVYSNLKFLQLFRSRLTEEGIPLAHAELIMEHVVVNMSEINEDDDYIGDVALHYAELCKKYYDALDVNTFTAGQAKVFNILPCALGPV